VQESSIKMIHYSSDYESFPFLSDANYMYLQTLVVLLSSLRSYFSLVLPTSQGWTLLGHSYIMHMISLILYKYVRKRSP
jgi:hypothetical protein